MYDIKWTRFVWVHFYYKNFFLLNDINRFTLNIPNFFIKTSNIHNFLRFPYKSIDNAKFKTCFGTSKVFNSVNKQIQIIQSRTRLITITQNVTLHQLHHWHNWTVRFFSLVVSYELSVQRTRGFRIRFEFRARYVICGDHNSRFYMER